MSIKRNGEPEEKNRVEGGTLYLVATPIGNLADLSERAIKVLGEVDFIAAEDTRNSMRLLTHLGISKPMISYFEHNKRERGPVIADRLAAGESCALITDAGTPAISDPGEDLVALCAQRGIPVTHIPGACAAIVALTLSGLPTGRFVFDGFLPVAKAERRERLAELAGETRTVILHEAPHKLRATLDDLVEALGDRPIALCRELTKRNEEIMRTTLSGAVEYYRTHDPRGEYVLVLAGGEKRSAAADEAFWQEMTPEAHVAYYEAQGASRMDAMKKAARDRGMSKSALYSLLLQGKEQGQG
ncbi:MAG: 16S rRNA (cytidine(1402)-2'-O)-methyltransferase [Ruminococcaceae bacterium]|nr:16S rRNA (cytidine(1402)-2'-O)-methyltransferase [Oscillospiraceae bacterium]